LWPAGDSVVDGHLGQVDIDLLESFITPRDKADPLHYLIQEQLRLGVASTPSTGMQNPL